MQNTRTRPGRTLPAVALVAGCFFAAMAAAQTSYPVKPVRIIVGQPPGGVQDTLARAMSEELTKVWGQPVTMDNRVGGVGVVAAVAAARSAPDGYTIFFSTSTNMNSAQFLRGDQPYHPEKDFVPVVGLAVTKSILAARNGLGVKTVKELVALARSKPGALNYGSFGVASAAHFDAEALANAGGFTATHIPYKSGPEVMTALLAGQVDFAMTALTAAIPLINSGKLTGLAYTGEKRAKALPKVPTLDEAGYKGLETGGLFALYVPAGTPTAIMDKIGEDASRIRSSKAFQENVIQRHGMEDFPLQGAALIRRLQQSRQDFATRIKGLNLNLK
jgi:tripartite-type tricarboxylate transporter receptor subunit TctC